MRPNALKWAPALVIALVMSACASRTPMASRPTSPSSPVHEREIRALADMVTRLRVDPMALQRALDAGHAPSVYLALSLSPSACEELGARAHSLATRIKAADGRVIQQAGPPPRGCSEAFRPCCQTALMAALFTGRSAAMMAGIITLGILRCRCEHCARGRLGQVCDAIHAL